MSWLCAIEKCTEKEFYWKKLRDAKCLPCDVSVSERERRKV